MKHSQCVHFTSTKLCLLLPLALQQGGVVLIIADERTQETEYCLFLMPIVPCSILFSIFFFDSFFLYSKIYTEKYFFDTVIMERSVRSLMGVNYLYHDQNNNKSITDYSIIICRTHHHHYLQQ